MTTGARTPRSRAGAQAPKTYAGALSQIAPTSPADSVIVVVKPGCPHCAKCLESLVAASVPVTVVPVGSVNDATLEGMAETLSFATYPRVFVRGVFHGGNDAVAGAIAAYVKGGGTPQ